MVIGMKYTGNYIVRKVAKIQFFLYSSRQC